MLNLNGKYLRYTRAVAARVGAQDSVALFKAAEEEALISLQAALGHAAPYSGAPLWVSSPFGTPPWPLG